MVACYSSHNEADSEGGTETMDVDAAVLVVVVGHVSTDVPVVVEVQKTSREIVSAVHTERVKDVNMSSALEGHIVDLGWDELVLDALENSYSYYRDNHTFVLEGEMDEGGEDVNGYSDEGVVVVAVTVEQMAVDVVVDARDNYLSHLYVD